MLNRKLMIVEDEHDVLLLYKDYLKIKGYSVIASSTTADEALIDYKKYGPDLLIMDYRLPGKKNGLEAAKEILKQNPSARVLIVSGFENVKAEITSDKFFSDKNVVVLIKPLKLTKLVNCIQNI